MRDIVRVADFSGLFRKLRVLVERETKSKMTDSDRSVMESSVTAAIMVYRGHKSSVELASRFTLHEIAEPLNCVIKLLEDEANRDAILVALGAPEWLAIRGRFSVGLTGKPIVGVLPEEQQATTRYEELLGDLRKIAATLPSPPAKRKRGKPPTEADFRAFIDRLATCWERASGTPFRQTNRPREFVYAVVALLAPARLNKLPKVIESIVAERRAQISG
jgi:hypothetical protein